MTLEANNLNVIHPLCLYQYLILVINEGWPEKVSLCHGVHGVVMCMCCLEDIAEDYRITTLVPYLVHLMSY